MRLYALLDRKASALSNFHVERMDAVASRTFADAVNAPNSVLGRYPEDFVLVCVGEVYDDDLQQPVKAFAQGYLEVLSAAQVVALRPKDAGEQLTLLKER